MVFILAALSSEEVGDIPDGGGSKGLQGCQELSKCTREVIHSQGPRGPIQSLHYG